MGSNGNSKDLTGRIFGRWTAIKKVESNKHKRVQWLCKCSCELGTIKIMASCNLLNGSSKSCGCYKLEKAHKIHYKGTKDISGRYFTSLKVGAESRNIIFNIIIDEIQELLEKQEYTSNLSGVKICGSINTTKRCSTYKEQTASLDRINPTKGYTIDNVQWIHKDENFAKQSMNNDEFIQMCTNIANHNKKSRIKKCYRYEKKAI